jgi:hypothetical protein
MLADRSTEYCGKREDLEYELSRSVEDIDPSKTKPEARKAMVSVNDSTKSVLQELNQVPFRKKSIIPLTNDSRIWIIGSRIIKNEPIWENTVLENPMQTFWDWIYVFHPCKRGISGLLFYIK